jgi:DNA-binding transcriptional LysR family regulator
MLQQLGDVLSRMDEVVDLAGTLNAHPRGRLKLTAGIGFGIEVLTELIPEFSLAYPDVAITLDLTSDTVDLLAEQVDVAFRMGALVDSSLLATRLGTIGCQLCAAPSYLERRGVPRSTEELAGHDLLAIPRPDGLPRRWTFQDARGNQSIIDMSHETEADLIVMSTDGRNGFLDGLRGSHSERVLRQAGVPLLTVPLGSLVYDTIA